MNIYSIEDWKSVSDIVVNISTIIGAIVALYFINNWRNEHLHRARDEELKRLLDSIVAVYLGCTKVLSALHSVEIRASPLERKLQNIKELSPEIHNTQMQNLQFSTIYQFAAPLISPELRNEILAFLNAVNLLISKSINIAKLKVEEGFPGESDKIKVEDFQKISILYVALVMVLADERLSSPQRRKLADDTIKAFEDAAKLAQDSTQL